MAPWKGMEPHGTCGGKLEPVAWERQHMLEPLMVIKSGPQNQNELCARQNVAGKLSLWRQFCAVVVC